MKSIKDPREKGDFANVELEVVSFRKSRKETSLAMMSMETEGETATSRKVDRALRAR